MEFANATAAEENFRSSYIAPQWFLSTLNFLATAAVVVNTVHIILLSKMNPGKKVADRNFKTFVLYLAVTDLLLSAGHLCLDHKVVQQYMYYNSWLCITSTTVFHSLNVFETNLLALVSIERYIAVSSCAEYANKLFIRHYSKFLGIFLVIWFMFYITIAAVFNEIGYQLQGASKCSLSTSKVPWLDAVSGIAALTNFLVFVIFYCLLVYKSTRMRRLIGMGIETNQRSRIQKRATRLNRIVGILILSKIILWMPNILALILKIRHILTEAFSFAASISLYSNSIANPLLYGVSSPQYRRTIRIQIFGVAENSSKQLAGGTTDVSSVDRGTV